MIGQVDEARGRPARTVLVVALGVGGVLAAVAGRAVLLAGGGLGVGQQQQVLGCAVLGRQAVARPRVALGRRLVEGVHGAEAHVGGGGRGGLDQRPQRLGPQVADGTVDGLVDDVGLDQLICSSIVGEVGQTFVTWETRETCACYTSLTLWFHSLHTELSLK